MYYVIYNLFLVLATPVIMGLLLTKKRCQRGLWPRFGSVPVELRNVRKPVIWIHAVSLGEVATIVPLLQAMKERYPQWPLVVSTVTETGREVVLKRLDGVALHCYAPLDYGWAVDRYVRLLKPHLFILVESEFWPNLLKSLQRHQVPVCLLNGRISSRSFSRYLWIKGMMKHVMRCIDLALMQSTHDAKRIGQLGARPDTVHVTGNMKFDQSLDQFTPIDGHSPLRTTFVVNTDEILIVAGSTHPQEEEYLLDAYREVVDQHPQVVLLMAPRHIERASKLEQVIRRYGFTCVRRSQSGQTIENQPDKGRPRVILLDTRGELPLVYGEGYLTFVGGTMVPVGGHNLIEPAQWGKPVLFGPYVDHCRDIASLLLEAGGGLQIQNQHELASQIIRLIAHPSEADGMGKKAFEVVQAHRGVTVRNLQWIDRLMGKDDSSASRLAGIESSASTSHEILR
jgi:3-deoxy-D-manno-octulosonic-acid transferase